ncbi:CDP-archaeol synthase [Nanoarchaeota archaeon]
MILTLILSGLYYFLPAYFANMAPVILKKINFLKYPVDFNKKIGQKRIFGSHKTWGGLFLAIILGTLVFYLQKLVFTIPFFQNYSLIDYSQSSILLGLLLSSGAIIGDLVKSFFKRRISINPGKPWIPFDQIDYVLGALAFSAIIYLPKLSIVLIILIASPLLHIITNLAGYYLRISKTKL